MVGVIYIIKHTMKKNTLNKDLILKTYDENKDKGKYWVADYLNLNRNSVSSLIDRYRKNSNPIDQILEQQLLETIKLFPYTGTKNKIQKYLNISRHCLSQAINKTDNHIIKEHFKTPKASPNKLSDNDIQFILDGSKTGIGNDKMGIILNIDGICIRNIRKKFLTKEEYEKYHSIEKFYSGNYNAYYNDRGDKFLSTWEEKVANHLHNKKIKYFSNIRIHYKEKNYSPDFYLPKNRVFIEVFGMSNVECYKEGMMKKMKFYEENNIKYLALLEEDFILNRKPIHNFENKIDNFIDEIKNQIFNNHIKKIYIHKL
jgi:hypothetical protein